jgi:hypothetical protein
MGTFNDLIDETFVRPRREAEAKRREAQEAAASKQRAADALAKAKADGEQLAALEAQLRQKESELRQAEARARNRAIDEEARRIAAVRKSEGRRELPAGELRSKAARRVAKVESGR